MARQINRLNPAKVRAISQPGLHADGAGLYLEVSKSGSKAWTMLYRWQGKTRQLGLGPIRLVSLAEARDKARDIAKMVSQGINPREQAEADKAEAVTFGQVALELISDRESGWKNAKHKKQWRSTLETYAASIWEKPVGDVNAEDLLKILRPIWNVKPETAMRVRGRIESVLNAAKVRGLRIGENPAAWRGNLDHLLARPRRGAKQHHAAMPFADLPEFMVRLGKAKGLGARALELLIHTAARTSEVLQARWSEFDLDAGLWVIPADRMKAGKEHRVPLSQPVLALLKALPRTGDYLFPGQTPGKHLSNMVMAMTLRRMEELDCTVHGFRSSFRDWCGECTKFPGEIAEHALAHQVGSEVERAYRRGDALAKRRELMDQWSAYLGSAQS